MCYIHQGKYARLLKIFLKLWKINIKKIDVALINYRVVYCNDEELNKEEYYEKFNIKW